jgi:ectoine hydroxylase-related dioxygenase (phytanoyl-CoA dioxygenase family)
MSLVEHLVGPDWLVSCVDAQIQHPGAGMMPLHIDQWWMPAPQLPGNPPARPAATRRGTGTSRDPSPAAGPIAPIACANVMWMVTDFTEENGATRLVPGSHLSGRQPDPTVPHPVSTVAATGPAGTAFAFDARLWHGASANHRPRLRGVVELRAYRRPRCRVQRRRRGGDGPARTRLGRPTRRFL